MRAMARTVLLSSATITAEYCRGSYSMGAMHVIAAGMRIVDIRRPFSVYRRIERSAQLRPHAEALDAHTYPITIDLPTFTMPTACDHN
jgi:hypothetical protein